MSTDPSIKHDDPALHSSAIKLLQQIDDKTYIKINNQLDLNRKPYTYARLITTAAHCIGELKATVQEQEEKIKALEAKMKKIQNLAKQK